MGAKANGLRCALGGLLALLGPAVLLASEAAAEKEAGGDLLPKLKPTAWGILVFLTVLFILWKKAYPPILEALDRRARLIRESLDAAERAKKEAEEVMARHEESLEKARVEARAIIEEGKADAQQVKEKIVADARKEAEDIAARARREIDLAKDAAVDDLHRQAVELSLEIASRVIQKALRPEDHQKLIQESIRKFREIN